MIKRVDTTDIARGAKVSLAVFLKEEPNISIYFFAPEENNSVEILDFSVEEKDSFYSITTKTPSKNGYLLVKINTVHFIRKVGVPTKNFVLGYKKNYTINYKKYSINSEVLEEGTFKEIIDGFYFTKLNVDVFAIEFLKVKFLVATPTVAIENGEVVVVGNAVLDEVEIENYELNSVGFGEYELNSIDFGEYELNSIDISSELPNVNLGR